MDHVSATSLPPGFRFQPKEDELFYYLKHKVYRMPLNFALEPIADVDVYKVEPWDLPGNSRDRECYFFSALGRIGNGSRIKRTTEKGYWKITGKDRAVRHNSRTLGMKRILVFRIGRSPRGDPTNWVMHEYRLVDEELKKAGIAADAPVLCKIFQNTGTGPQNGEVSFGEVGEEHDDMGVVVPGEEAATEEVVVGDGENVNAKELDQDKSNYFVYSGEFNGGYQQSFIGTGETSGLHHGQKFDDIQEQYGMDANPLRDGLFIEANDLSNPIDPVDVDMADTFLNLENDFPDIGFYPSELLGTENNSSHQTPVTRKNEIGEADQVSKESLHLSKLPGSSDASSSKHNPKALMDVSGVTLPGNFSELEKMLDQTLETQCGDWHEFA